MEFRGTKIIIANGNEKALASEKENSGKPTRLTYSYLFVG